MLQIILEIFIYGQISFVVVIYGERPLITYNTGKQNLKRFIFFKKN